MSDNILIVALNGCAFGVMIVMILSFLGFFISVVNGTLNTSIFVVSFVVFLLTLKGFPLFFWLFK